MWLKDDMVESKGKSRNHNCWMHISFQGAKLKMLIVKSNIEKHCLSWNLWNLDLEQLKIQPKYWEDPDV